MAVTSHRRHQTRTNPATALIILCAGLVVSVSGCGPKATRPDPEVATPPPARAEQAEPQKESREIPPDNAELSSRLRLALALNKEAEWRAALEHLEILRKYQPTSWIVQLEFAHSTYRLNGDLDEVRAALKKSLELNERNPRALVMLGQLHEDQGDNEKAEEYYRQGIAQRASDPEPHLALARVLRRTGRDAEAVEVLEALVERERRSVRLLVLLANAYEAADDLESAAATWKMVARNHVDPLQGKTLLYRFLVRTRQMAQANELAAEITAMREERASQRGLRPLRPSPDSPLREQVPAPAQ